MYTTNSTAARLSLMQGCRPSQQRPRKRTLEHKSCGPAVKLQCPRLRGFVASGWLGPFCRVLERSKGFQMVQGKPALKLRPSEKGMPEILLSVQSIVRTMSVWVAPNAFWKRHGDDCSYPSLENLNVCNPTTKNFNPQVSDQVKTSPEQDVSCHEVQAAKAESEASGISSLIRSS